MNIWLMILYVFLFFFYLCHPIMIICLLSLRVKYYLYYNWFVNLVDIQDSPKEPTTPQENGLPAQETSKWHVHELCVYICRYSKLHWIPFSFISQFFFCFVFFLQEFFFLVTLLKCCFQDCLRLTYFVGNCISFYIYICICIYDDYIHFFFTCLHHLYINILLLMQYVFDIVYQSFHSMLHMKFLYTCLTFYCSSSSKLAFLYSILFIYLFSFFPVFPFSPHFQIKMHWKPKIPRFLEGTIHLRQLLVASKTM